MDLDSAVQTQLHNIETSTETPLQEWYVQIDAQRSTGLRHGQLVQWLKSEHGLTHGNANALVLASVATDSPDDLVAAQYSGSKAGLRPIHDALIEAAVTFHDDVEVAPKKTSVSLRRSRQFAVITPASQTRIDLGLNLRGREPFGRLEATTGMCTHRVRLASVSEIDDEVITWLRDASDDA